MGHQASYMCYTNTRACALARIHAGACTRTHTHTKVLNKKNEICPMF